MAVGDGRVDELIAILDVAEVEVNCTAGDDTDTAGEDIDELSITLDDETTTTLLVGSDVGKLRLDIVIVVIAVDALQVPNIGLQLPAAQ